MRLKRLWRLTVKLSPLLMVGIVLIVAGSTNWFSPQLEQQLWAQALDQLAALKPDLINVAIAFAIVYAAYLVFRPLRSLVEKCLAKFGKGFSERGRRLWLLTLQTGFWLVVIMTATRVVAPGLLQNLVVGGGFVAGAAIVAVDSVKNAISSAFLHTLPKCQEKDYIKVVGVEGAEGTIIKIDYLNTTIQPKDGGQKVILSNSTLLSSTLIVGQSTLPPEPKKDPVVVRVECRCANCGQTSVVTADASKPAAKP